MNTYFHIFIIFSCVFLNTYPKDTYAQKTYSKLQGEPGNKGPRGVAGNQVQPPSPGMNGQNGACLSSPCLSNTIPMAQHSFHATPAFIQLSSAYHRINAPANSIYVCVLENPIPSCDIYTTEHISGFVGFLLSHFTTTEALQGKTYFILAQNNILPLLNATINTQNETVFSFLISRGASYEILDYTETSSMLLIINSKNTFSYLSHNNISPIDVFGVFFHDTFVSSGVINTASTRSSRFLGDIATNTPFQTCQKGDLMVLENTFWTCKKEGSIKQRHTRIHTLSESKIAFNTLSSTDFKNNAFTSSSYIKNDTLLTQDIQQNTLTTRVFSSSSVQNGHFKPFSILSQHIQNQAILPTHIAPQNILQRHLLSNQITSNHIRNNAIVNRTIENQTIHSDSLSPGSVSEIKISLNNFKDGSKISNDMVFNTYLETLVMNVPFDNTTARSVISFSTETLNAQIQTSHGNLLFPKIVANEIIFSSSRFTCNGCVQSTHIGDGEVSLDSLQENAKIPSKFCVFVFDQNVSSCPSPFQEPSISNNVLLKIDPNKADGFVFVAAPSTIALSHNPHNHLWAQKTTPKTLSLYTRDGSAVGGAIKTQNNGQNMWDADTADDYYEVFGTTSNDYYTNAATEGAHTLSVSDYPLPQSLGARVCCMP